MIATEFSLQQAISNLPDVSLLNNFQSDFSDSASQSTVRSSSTETSPNSSFGDYSYNSVSDASFSQSPSPQYSSNFPNWGLSSSELHNVVSSVSIPSKPATTSDSFSPRLQSSSTASVGDFHVSSSSAKPKSAVPICSADYFASSTSNLQSNLAAYHSIPSVVSSTATQLLYTPSPRIYQNLDAPTSNQTLQKGIDGPRKNLSAITDTSNLSNDNYHPQIKKLEANLGTTTSASDMPNKYVFNNGTKQLVPPANHSYADQTNKVNLNSSKLTLKNAKTLSNQHENSYWNNKNHYANAFASPRVSQEVWSGRGSTDRSLSVSDLNRSSEGRMLNCEKEFQTECTNYSRNVNKAEIRECSGVDSNRNLVNFASQKTSKTLDNSALPMRCQAQWRHQRRFLPPSHFHRQFNEDQSLKQYLRQSERATRNSNYGGKNFSHTTGFSGQPRFPSSLVKDRCKMSLHESKFNEVPTTAHLSRNHNIAPQANYFDNFHKVEAHSQQQQLTNSGEPLSSHFTNAKCKLAEVHPQGKNGFQVVYSSLQKENKDLNSSIFGKEDIKSNLGRSERILPDRIDSFPGNSYDEILKDCSSVPGQRTKNSVSDVKPLDKDVTNKGASATKTEDWMFYSVGAKKELKETSEIDSFEPFPSSTREWENPLFSFLFFNDKQDKSGDGLSSSQESEEKLLETNGQEENTEKSCISLSHMADPTFTAFDGGTAKGAAPASPACASSKEGDGAYPSGAVTVLGSNLWNKTIPYDPDLKVALEFMDLEEFLNENNIPLNDSNRLSNFSEEKSSVDDNRKCSRLSTPGADVSCSFASLTTPVRCSSASTSPVHPALQTPPSCSPSSLHDSNSSSYHLPLQSDLSFMNANSQLLFEDSNDVSDCCIMRPERRSRSPENFNSLSPPSLLQSTNVNAKTNDRSVNSTSNSASEVPSTSSSHIFMKTPEFPNFGEYSVDFHGVTADQSSSGGENPPVMDKRSQNSNAEPHGKIGGSNVAEMSPDSWESSSQPCDTTCSSSTPDVTHDRGRRKNHGRGQATPSVGVRNRRRRGVASYAEIDDDIISDLCDFTKDEPQQVDERIAPAQRNPATKTGEKFNPRTRKFSEHELKPQPMVKKSRKQACPGQYVPPDLKDDKYWARRQKNNVAAKRSRDARRVKENQIALRASYLEEMHAKLKRQLDEANEVINALKERLSKYEAV